MTICWFWRVFLFFRSKKNKSAGNASNEGTSGESAAEGAAAAPAAETTMDKANLKKIQVCLCAVGQKVNYLVFYAS